MPFDTRRFNSNNNTTINETCFPLFPDNNPHSCPQAFVYLLHVCFHFHNSKIVYPSSDYPVQPLITQSSAYGLSPQTNGMPAIHIKTGNHKDCRFFRVLLAMQPTTPQAILTSIYFVHVLAP